MAFHGFSEAWRHGRGLVKYYEYKANQIDKVSGIGMETNTQFLPQLSNSPSQTISYSCTPGERTAIAEFIHLPFFRTASYSTTTLSIARLVAGISYITVENITLSIVISPEGIRGLQYTTAGVPHFDEE